MNRNFIYVPDIEGKIAVLSAEVLFAYMRDNSITVFGMSFDLSRR
jgi:hypothetical protein